MTARGTENAVNPSPNSEPARTRRDVLLDAALQTHRGTAPSAVLYRAIPLHLLDPPKPLVRPISDGEYLDSVVDSMKKLGQIDPIIVFPVGERYQVIDGMHRVVAAEALGWPYLRAQVFTDKDLAIEAIQLHTCQVHLEMTPWQEHEFYTRLCEEFKLGFEEVCVYTRKSEKYVSDRLLLGNLTEESKAALQRNAVSFGVARELLRLKDPAWERYYLDLCLRTGTGTQVLHGWVNQFLAKKELPTVEQIKAAEAPLPAPPPAPLIVCSLCGGEPAGRGMMQVWVHVDELQTIVQTIRATFQRAAASEASAPAGPE